MGLHPSQYTTLRRQDPSANFITINKKICKSQGQRQLYEDSLSQVLQRAAPWILSLSIHGHYSTRQLEFGERCTMINSLLIKGPPLGNRFDTTYWDSCKALVQQNSAHLRSLTMVCWNQTCGRLELPKWTPLSVQFKNLRSLIIQDSNIGMEQWASYWQVLENVESLTLESTPLHPQLSISDENRSKSSNTRPITQLPKLRTLILTDVYYPESEQQLDWLIRICPVLRTLEWTQVSGGFPVQFTQYFVDKTWPELDSITIRRDLNDVSHKDYITILQAGQRPFRVLDLGIERLELDLFDLLRQGHFKALTKVDLCKATVEPELPRHKTEGIPQWVQEVLESCPSLEHITAKIITAEDIINGKPWVCLGLKEFKVVINMGFRRPSGRGPKRPKFTDNQQGLCRAVFEQLGRLEQLRALDMRYLGWNHGTRYSPLPLELRLGLGLLSKLKYIEVIGFHHYQDMREADVEWMLRQWPYLSTIYGDRLSNKPSKTLGNEYVRNQLLMSVLNSRGVALFEA